jgi:hypothetical protein
MDFDAQTLQLFNSLIAIRAPRAKQVKQVKRGKELPEELQSIIQDFARPISRGDWRSCKREESRAIYLLYRDKRHVVADFLGGAEFWDIVIGHTFYELLRNYPAGPPSDEGQTTIQLRRVWG